MHIMTIKMRPYLVPALAEMDGVRLTVLDDPAYTPSYEAVESIREVIPFKSGGKFHLPSIRKIRRAVVRCRPDLIHAFYGRALMNAILATSWMKRPPGIVSFRGITAPASALDPTNWFSYRHRRVTAHACESDAVRDALVQSGIARDKCHTVYNCVPLTKYKRPGRPALGEFGIPDNAFVVGTVATMRPVKGIDLLLRAGDELADKQDMHWLLIGAVKDPRISELAANPRIASRVHLAGHRADAASLISSADAFVMPSRAEALSVALLEAMLQGICPVVSDAGGMKELVRHNQDGLVVPRENVAALAAALRELHADRGKLNRMATSARQRILDFASPHSMASRTATMYKQLLAAA